MGGKGEVRGLGRLPKVFTWYYVNGEIINKGKIYRKYRKASSF